MSAQLKTHWISVEEYLAIEENSGIKHEYINGEIYAMSGSSARHNQIAGNLFARLLNHLRGSPCQVFIADVKLHLREVGVEMLYYPDLMVCCDPDDRHPYYRMRPCLIVEVLSSETACTDRQEKLFAYTRLDSVQGYLLLEQDQMRAILHSREAGQWQRTEFSDPQGELTLPCTGLTIQLAELYEGAGLPETPRAV
ncbi:MAG: hypothetical protein QG599_1604 [Pseudomonadota bacterium]|nr:hypothetical protein [Pseudomonadota bacterium]